MMSGKSKGGLHIQAGLCSETGPRSENEDYVALCLEEPGRRTGIVAAIADGVGGEKGGRVAAELAVRSFIDGYVNLNETLGVRRTAAQSLEAVNRWTYAQGRVDSALARMCCTLTAAILRERRLHVLHVGDTRLYRLRAGRLAQLTTDHRPESGAMRNILTRAIGAEETVRIDYAMDTLEAHDRLLLCSDGLFETLSDRKLEQELGDRAAAEQTAKRLVQAALEAGASDNVTALVIDVLDLPAINPGDFWQTLAVLPVQPPPQVGAVVDDFELETMLADGRYSRVFKARDRLAERPVLIKFPKIEDVGAETSARSAFLCESWIGTRIQSPWIGGMIELPAERRTSLYFVQPYYDGETLEQRLRRRPPMPLGEGLEIAMKLAKGIAALHRAGVIHRDIKPENIILERDGGVKLIDLGVARLPNVEEFPSVDIPGTPSYMAPELFSGQPGDERSDLFALGVTIYRMFSGGAYPYGEIEPFSHPRFKRPALLSASRPDLPSWLDTILARAVAPAREDRIQDAVELAFELEHNAVKGVQAPRPNVGLYQRDPVRFLLVVIVVLVGLLIWSLAPS